MSRGWRVLVLPLVVACAASFPAVLWGQQPNQLGKIIGNVRVLRGDFPSIPVLITLEMRGSPIGSVYSDGQGRFGFYNLVSNEYRVSIDDDAYKPVSQTVVVVPTTSPINWVQFTLIPKEEEKKKDPAGRVEGSNPYLIDPAEYYRNFPKRTIKEFKRGVEADMQGEADEAISHYQKAVVYSPDFYPAHNNLGSAYLGRQQFAEAQSQFEAAIQANQNDPQAHLNLANVMLLTKHYDEATLEIEEGLKRQPNSPFGHFLRGSLYSHIGNPALAEKELLNTLGLDPKMSQAHLQLVNLYLQQKRKSEAMTQLDTYVKSFPDSPQSPKARELLKRLQAEEAATPKN